MNPQNNIQPNNPSLENPSQPAFAQPTPTSPNIQSNFTSQSPTPQIPQAPQPPQPAQSFQPSAPNQPPAYAVGQPTPTVQSPVQPTQLTPAQLQAQQTQNPPAQPTQPPAKQPAAKNKKKPQPANSASSLSTQANLLISELRDSVVIMKDGSFRAVVACKSINFDLMSESEREGVEYSYQNFINSLNFTTQILIRSQRIDIAPYLERLSEIRRNTDNMLLGVLMDDYINFIDILSQEANIMDKSFFIVIPYYTSADAEKLVEQTRNFFKSFSTKNKGPEVTKIDRNTYDKALTEINNRVDAVISGLFQIGIHSVRLNTRELSELYYNFNNPDTAVREPYIDFSKMATTYVRKGEKNA